MTVDGADHPTTLRQTRLGPVQGFERLGVETLLGLRYALRPERFRPPVRATEPWEGTYDATRHAGYAVQDEVSGSESFLSIAGEMSEDCLFLNAYVPQAPSSEPRPVLVWIHGGGFTAGSPNQYDGTALAAQADAVVVSVGYRLGILGTVDLTEVGLDGSDHLYLRDIVCALEWIRDNIADYGGDPDLVTVIGQSAGASCVLALCAAPSARGLFHRAVSLSPGSLVDVAGSDVVDRLAKARRTTRAKLVADLRSAPAAALGKLSRRLAAHNPPRSGTSTVPTTTLEGLAAHPVPLVIGFAPHEGDFFRVFMAMMSPLMRGPLGSVMAGMMASGMTMFAAPDKAGRRAYLNRLRLVSGVRGRGWAWTDVAMTDMFRRTSVRHAEVASGYLYELDVPCEYAGQAMRSTHTGDLSLLFDPWSDTETNVLRIVTDEAVAPLAKRWIAMIAQFARTGDPSGPLGPWPAYDRATRRSLLITPERVTVESDRDRTYRTSVWPA